MRCSIVEDEEELGVTVEEDDEEGVVIEEGEVLGEEEGVVGLQEVMNETAKRDVNRSLAFSYTIYFPFFGYSPYTLNSDNWAL